MKTGLQWSFGQEGNSVSRNADLNQNYRSGVADSVDVYNTPTRNDEYVNADVGVYVQDAWTMNRLTLTGGLAGEPCLEPHEADDDHHKRRSDGKDSSHRSTPF